MTSNESIGHIHKNKSPCRETRALERARDEIRTRDIHLGKVVLYQLSYSRIKFFQKASNLLRRDFPIYRDDIHLGPECSGWCSTPDTSGSTLALNFSNNHLINQDEISRFIGTTSTLDPNVRDGALLPTCREALSH